MNHTDPTAAVTVTAQTISALVSGQPDLKNKFGPGHIRPDGVRLTYRGQHIDARVDGRWVRETGELTTERLDQHYTVREAADIVAWPDWLCALATLLRPAAASAAVVSPPTSRAELRDRIAAAIWARYPDAEPSRTGLVMANPHALADAVLAVLGEPTSRAAVLLDAAALLDQRATGIDAFASSDYGPEAEAVRALADAANELRRLGAEAQQQPDTETHSCPNCEGVDPRSCLMNPARPKKPPMDPVHILGIDADVPAPAEQQPAAADDEETEAHHG